MMNGLRIHTTTYERPARDAGGFALVAVLIILVAVTALATGGFVIANTDYEISHNHTASAHAFNTADAAMFDHMGVQKRGVRTINYNYASGAATVTGSQLLDMGDGNFLYQLVSTATHQMPRGGTSGREVSLVAMSHDGGLKANAALTAGTGVVKNGTSGTISGFDQATTGHCSAGAVPDVAGVATGPGLYTQTGGGGGGGGGGGLVPTGTPPIEDTQSGYDQLVDLGIDWAGILAGTAVHPDFVFPGDTWPNFAMLDPDWWPVFYFNSSVSVDAAFNGRGTFIATHDLHTNGDWLWDGIVLVGGEMTVNGNATIEGTAITGLNLLTGGTPPPTTIANGTKVFQFNSCWVRFAAQQFLSGLVWVPGTWAEGM